MSEYYIVYDFNDNIIAYIETLEELAYFVNRRKKQLKYKFKKQNCVYIEDKNIFKVYKFS